MNENQQTKQTLPNQTIEFTWDVWDGNMKCEFLGYLSNLQNLSKSVTLTSEQKTRRTIHHSWHHGDLHHLANH